MEQAEALLEFIISIFNLLFNVIGFLGSSLINGLNFFITTFVTIPNVLFEIFNELPSFYKIGITGVFGCLLLVVFLKLIALVR